VGAVLLGVGCWYLVDTRSNRFSDVSKDASLTSLFHSAAVIVCVVGGVIILVALLGCFAACRESYLALVIVRHSYCVDISVYYYNEQLLSLVIMTFNILLFRCCPLVCIFLDLYSRYNC